MTTQSICVDELITRFSDESEFALIDVREEGVFTRGHLLAASNLPLSRIELLIEDAIPRTHTEIILCDEPTAARAIRILNELGYENLTVLTGGLSSWSLSGRKLFSGVNVPGKAFGEYIENARGTPALSATELKLLLESENPPLLLDTRTPEEHSSYCIPGALSCPNGELVWRALHHIKSPDQVVIAHCAGRTRSIIGAQTLIDAGIANPVYSLENGTLAWAFENYELEYNANRPLSAPKSEQHDLAMSAARRLRGRHAIGVIERSTLEDWRLDADRSVYVFDVRSGEEFSNLTLPGAYHVPGGQLVQNVDRYLVTRGARVVLFDTDGVRASATGAWLRQMGWREVYTLTLDITDEALSAPPRIDEISPPTVDDAALESILAQNTGIVVDIRRSVDYRRGHIPGAWFLTRARLDEDYSRLPALTDIVLIADDLQYAALIISELESRGRRVWMLDGAMDAWRRSGRDIETGTNHLASEPDDTHLDALDFDESTVANREGRDYLEWEIALVRQLEGDPGAPYAR